MPALHGDASAFPLPEVLSFLSTTRKSGTLTLTSNERSSGGKSPWRNDASTSGAAATISVSAGRSTAKTSRTSVVTIPGS